jgi:phosphoribosylformylglycinamidine synthase
MMAKRVKVIVLRTAGTNCDAETAFAFESFGAQVDKVHVKRLLKKEVSLKDYHVFVIPGGFTYGDDIESGRILANELRLFLGNELKEFISDGKLVLGICNGFQVLVKAGILPGQNDTRGQQSTLTNNNSGKFEDRWIYLKPEGKSVWVAGMSDVVFFPVAHAEGKFIPLNENIRKAILQNQIVFRYCAQNGQKPDYPLNPNGSADDIAGISDPTGRVLGLMPHPERHFLFIHHPFWTRLPKNGKFGQGAKIFENGVEYVKKNLL